MSRVVVTRNRQEGEPSMEGRSDTYLCSMVWNGQEGHCSHCGSRIAVEPRDFDSGQRCFGDRLILPCPRWIGRAPCPGVASLTLPRDQARLLPQPEPAEPTPPWVAWVWLAVGGAVFFIVLLIGLIGSLR